MRLSVNPICSVVGICKTLQLDLNPYPSLHKTPMEKHVSKNHIVTVMGNNLFEPVIYTETRQSVDKGIVLSNKNQYFEGVPQEFLGFHIDIYQICKNWFKAREGCPLNNEDTQRYQRIIMLLKEIVKLIEEIKIAIQCNQLKKLEIFEKVRAIIVDMLGIEPNRVTPTANFANELGTDSLDTVELVMALEEAFDIEILDTSAKSFLTLQQIIDHISQKIDFAN